MAKQSGVVKIRGAVDDLTFMETKDGFKVRKKGRVVTKATIATDPRYARMRENMSEFSRAVEGSKLLRLAVQDALLDIAEKRLGTRLNKALMTVLMSDHVSARGKRLLMKGDAKLLKDFAFNSNAVLTQVFKVTPALSIDRVTGKLTVDIPAFIPENVITSPAGTTHFKIHSAAAEINFDTGVFITKQLESAAIKNDDVMATAASSQQHALTPNSTNPLFLLLGIRFFQEVNGNLYPIKNSAFNALNIVDAASV